MAGAEAIANTQDTKMGTLRVLLASKSSPKEGLSGWLRRALFIAAEPNYCFLRRRSVNPPRANIPVPSIAIDAGSGALPTILALGGPSRLK